MSVLLDTNVLVYLHDASAPAKQLQAWKVSQALASAGQGVVSTQVLSEFFSVLTGRLRHRMTYQIALARLRRQAQAWPVLEVTAPVILQAARAVGDHQLNFWDAKLWAVAKLNGVRTILSEDFNCGATLDGVHFVNPFDKNFHLRQILS